MQTGIYITENTRLDYQGSALINASLNGDLYEKDFSKIQKLYPKSNWSMLDLNMALKSNTEPEIVFLSRNAAPYLDAVKSDFPNANVQVFDTWRDSY